MKSFASEREILYKILFDLKNEFNDMKKLVNEILSKGELGNARIQEDNAHIMNRLYGDSETVSGINDINSYNYGQKEENDHIVDTEEIVEESLSIEDKEIELIQKALEKHAGKRKYAANELGISERTLYRKIKEYNLQ